MKSSLDPAKHFYLPLKEPVNDFRIEGALVLPPKDIPQKRGKLKMALFIVGHAEPRRDPLFGREPLAATITVYDDLARDVLRNYRQGDHVIVSGGFTTWRGRPGRPALSLVATRIERVGEKPKRRGGAERVLREVLSSADAGAG